MLSTPSLSRRLLLSRVSRPAVALFVALLATYAYVFPRWADWNQNSRFDLVVALVDGRTLQIDRYVANTGDYALYQGHYYSDKAPGVALLGVPVYAVVSALLPPERIAALGAGAASSQALGATLREGGAGLGVDRLRFFVGLVATTFVAVAVPSAVLGVLLYWLGGVFGWARRQRVASSLLFGLATPAVAYANAFVGHMTSAFLLFAAFCLLVARRRGSLRSANWLLLVGFLLGYAAITEYPTVLVGGLLGLYALWNGERSWRALSWRAIPWGTAARLVLGALPPLALMAAHNLAAFGTPLPVGYFYSALWTGVHQSGLVSVTYPQAEALWGITFGQHRGLFFLSPYLLLAVPGAVSLWRRAPAETLVLGLAFVAFLLFNGSSAMWQGGFAVGPRYLVPALPFLAVLAGAGVGAAWRHPAARPVVLLAVAWSLFAVWAETLGGQSFPDYTANPLFDYSLPRLLAGDVARNAGMALRLAGWASLAPLVAMLAVVALLGFGPWPRGERGTRAGRTPSHTGVAEAWAAR